MKTVAICQARIGSQRLPGKVMKELGPKPLLKWTLDACDIPAIDTVVLATSTLKDDDVIADYCRDNDIECFRGSETDVLDRFYQCAKKCEADIVLRFTCDCCFLDPQVINEVIKLREMTNADYASNCYPPTYPDGLDVECFTFKALETAWKEATSKIDRDCLTQYIVRNRTKFKVANLTCPLPGLVNEHWVCDSPEDFRFCEKIVERLSDTQKFTSYVEFNPPSYMDILNILDREPELRKINSKSIRNERFYDALSQEQLPARTFERSERVFQRVSKSVPSGAQTFSKSHHLLPVGHYPLYASHGEGGYIFDVNGNRYVDLIGGLLPIILGHCDPDVDEAIRRQLDKGITLSLATEMEGELAELLCRHIPCAEMVRLGKTGTDVTTAAVRLARAYTGRDHVITSGYHGWSDWSVARTERNHGVPEDVKRLIHQIESGQRYDKMFYNEINPAAIIVESDDNPDYLQWLREYCDEYGVVLIFDEIITGFRWDLGGAQKIIGVTPDLACFGKSMANGMPISALVGKKEIMFKLDNPNVFFSGTFFGESLSIAAAIATIKKLESHKVIEKITNTGIHLERFIIKILKQLKLPEITIDGWYTNMKIKFNDSNRAKAKQLQSMFMSKMAQNGVLIINCNGLMYAHGEPEMRRIKTAYENTLRDIAEAIDSGQINDVEPIIVPSVRELA